MSHDKPPSESQSASDAAQKSAADAATQSAFETLESAEIEQLRLDLKEAGDRVLRAQAELENFRKRARRELEDEKRYANLPLVRDLLPVVDNIHRAIDAAQKTSEAATLLEGVKMVAAALDGVLIRHDCKKIDALHKPFDPAFHEAIAQQPSKEFPPHTVIAVAHEGYTLHDRVARPAQVMVSAADEAGE